MRNFTQLLNEFTKAVADVFRRDASLRSGSIRVVNGGSNVVPAPGEVVVWSSGVAASTALGPPQAAPGAVVFSVPTGSAATLYVSDGTAWKSFAGV